MMGEVVRAALYARVSTRDKHQNPDVQLRQMRSWCELRGWEIVEEYTDVASANDMRRRERWRHLVDDVARRRFDVVLVQALDRAFRSVKHLHDTLEAFGLTKTDFTSVREQIDTSTAMGRFFMTVLGALAELELSIIRERINAGQEHARAHGKVIGRAPAINRPAVKQKLADVLRRVLDDELSQRDAAVKLEIGRASLSRGIQWLVGPGTGFAGDYGVDEKLLVELIYRFSPDPEGNGVEASTESDVAAAPQGIGPGV